MVCSIVGLLLSLFCLLGPVVAMIGMTLALGDYHKIQIGRLPRSEMPKVAIAWTCGALALLWTAVVIVILLASSGG